MPSGVVSRSERKEVEREITVQEGIVGEKFALVVRESIVGARRVPLNGPCFAKQRSLNEQRG